MIKWLGENGGELGGTKKYLHRIFLYKLDSFTVGFIGDEHVHAQCYVHRISISTPTRGLI